MSPLRPVLRWTLTGFAGLAAGALLLLFLGAEDTEDWFSWTIQPPLSAASLGAFYGAALVLFIGGLRAPGPATARQIAPPVLAIAIALLVVTLVHLDKFDTDSLFGIFWLSAYIVAPPLMLWAILDQRRAGGSPTGVPLPRPLRVVLGVEGALMLGAAAVLLLAPETAADHWPWALTPLVARVYGAFTLGVALVALIVTRDGFAGSRGIAGAYLTLGAVQLLALLIHRADLGGDDTATAVYIGFLALVLATGAYGLSSSASALSRS